MLAAEALLIVLPAAIPAVVDWGSPAGLSAVAQETAQWATYGVVALTGWLVGVEFPLGNRLYAHTGATVVASAGTTGFADYMGSAAGAVAMGVVCLPVFGVAQSCWILAALKGGSLLALISILPVRPAGETHPSG
jgi:predicted membrane-bound spermidine synthase